MRFAKGLAVVEGFDHRQALRIGADGFGGAQQDTAAVGRQHLAPAATHGVVGGGYRSVDVFLVACRYVSECLAQAGVENRHGFAAGGRTPGAIDEVRVGQVGEGAGREVLVDEFVAGLAHRVASLI
ncbi:hypothetical protein D3C81_1723910 [compost metagenome]